MRAIVSDKTRADKFLMTKIILNLNELNNLKSLKTKL